MNTLQILLFVQLEGAGNGEILRVVNFLFQQANPSNLNEKVF